MLDQLVESKSHMNEDKRRSGFMLTILIIAVVGVVTAWGVDLFGKDIGMGDDELALTTLVAPVPVEEEPPPEPEKKPEQKQPDVDVRKELIQNMMETPVKPPDKISAEKNQVKERRLDRMTMVGNADSDKGDRVDPNQARTVTGGNPDGGSPGGTEPTGGDAPTTLPPPSIKKEVPKMISKGVLNGSAISLPKPAYPPMAKQNGIKGTVTVQVVISESGSVISASAASGHVLLKSAAVAAARGARFSPTLLSGTPVKVSGVITYNFN